MCVNGRKGCKGRAELFGCCPQCLAERMDGATFADQFQAGYSYRSRIVLTSVIDSVVTVSSGASETTRHVLHRGSPWLSVVAFNEPHDVIVE